MSASLPRVFEDVDGNGDVRPVEVPTHLNKIGGEFDADELSAVATTTVRAPRMLLLLLLLHCRVCGTACQQQQLPSCRQRR